MPRFWALGVIACLSCSRSSTAPVDAGPPSATASDAERSVYPVAQGAASPEAERYCGLLYERPERKRRACCPKTAFTPTLLTRECVRVLSHSLKTGAVSLAAADLLACEAAVATEEQHCDWGGARPAACQGIVHGLVAESGECRSALECRVGLRCLGLGTTEFGRCAKPASVGERCGAPPDLLSGHLGEDVELAHPSCSGFCRLSHCTTSVSIAARCSMDNECGPGNRCQAEKCSRAPLPAAGQPCEGTRCAAGLRCWKGACREPKRLGQACERDEECRSQFCHSAVCALSCDPIRPPH